MDGDVAQLCGWYRWWRKSTGTIINPPTFAYYPIAATMTVLKIEVPLQAATAESQSRQAGRCDKDKDATLMKSCCELSLKTRIAALQVVVAGSTCSSSRYQRADKGPAKSFGPSINRSTNHVDIDLLSRHRARLFSVLEIVNPARFDDTNNTPTTIITPPWPRLLQLQLQLR